MNKNAQKFKLLQAKWKLDKLPPEQQAILKERMAIKLKKRKLERKPGLNKEDRAREIMALAVENGSYKNIPILQKAVTAIASWVKARLRAMGFNFKWVNSMSEGEIFAMLREGERLLEGGRQGGKQSNMQIALASRNKENSLDSVSQSSEDGGNRQGEAYGHGQKILATRIARLGIPGIDIDDGGIARAVDEQQQNTGSEERSADGDRAGGNEETARAEQAKLIATAKANGFFYEDESPFMRAVMSHENKGGTEHDAYFVGKAPNIVVIRSTANSGFGITSSDSPAQYLKRMEEYNSTFPLLQIRVIGVSQNSDGVPVIWTAQSFIHGEVFKTPDELSAAFAKKGWYAVPGTTDRYQHKETGAVIDDAHIFNVLHIGDKLYPIDIVVKEVPKNGIVRLSRKTPSIAQGGNSASFAAPEPSSTATPQEVSNWKSKLASALTHARPAMLGALTRLQLVDIYVKEMPELARYSSDMHKMEGAFKDRDIPGVTE